MRLYLIGLVALLSCSSSPELTESKLPIEKLRLPDGFSISVYASGVTNARAMAMGDNGTLFVGSRREGNVYALVDENKDGKADQMFVIDKGLDMPTGLAFKDGNLYVGDVSTIYVYENIEKNLKTPPSRKVLNDSYPSDTHHGWKYLAFGPDGDLYVPVGAPCNICDNEDINPIYASITKLDIESGEKTIVAKGIRNTVGFTWHPITKDLWFTDNGRDWLGDNIPPCELNVVTDEGQHFGYPFLHGKNIKDPEFGSKAENRTFTLPAQELGPHTAPLGMKFYSGNVFPDEYQNNVAFIAEHGSWNRSKKLGYRVMMVSIEDNKGTSYEPFIEGWLDEKSDEIWGRPVDILVLDDGSMLISDDFANAIYRVTYNR